MKPLNNKNGRFKSKGSEILRNTPSSVKQFINDSRNTVDSTASGARSTNPQNHNSRNDTSKLEPRLGRLHIEIRFELVQQLLHHVYLRKGDPEFKGRATQRAIIEEALYEYFRRSLH